MTHKVKAKHKRTVAKAVKTVYDLGFRAGLESIRERRRELRRGRR